MLTFSRFTYVGSYFEDNVRVSYAAVSDKILVTSQSSPFAKRLRAGQTVSAGQFASYFDGRSIYLVDLYGGGSFRNSGEGFVGFKFDVGNGTQYGWARVQMGQPPKHKFLVVDYAWGDPGDRILAGQTSSVDDQASAVPNEGSLGLLALGGVGLLAWRKRRRSSAASDVGLT